jgi:hypothetical protein
MRLINYKATDFTEVLLFYYDQKLCFFGKILMSSQEGSSCVFRIV